MIGQYYKELLHGFALTLNFRRLRGCDFIVQLELLLCQLLLTRPLVSDCETIMRVTQIFVSLNSLEIIVDCMLPLLGGNTYIPKFQIRNSTFRVDGHSFRKQ